jgi:hypothetical protein
VAWQDLKQTFPLCSLKTERPTALGRVQAALGRVQAALGRVQAALGRVQAALGRVQAALGRVQAALGRVQAAFSGGGGGYKVSSSNATLDRSGDDVARGEDPFRNV